MKQDQEQNCHVCRFCKQGFSNGKKLGGHMRRHLALIATCKSKGFQETINGEKGLHLSNNNDDQIIRKQSIQESDQLVNKSQQEHDSGGNLYVLRQNPKRSWRVCDSSKDYDVKCGKDDMKMKNIVCEKCGKGFDSMRALYGHMRCHSMKRSRPLDESDSLSSSDEHEDDGEVKGLVRYQRLCTRYKSVKRSHVDVDDDEVEQGVLCLMMLSRGVRSLEGLNWVRSGQMSLGRSRSTLVKYESNMKQRSYHQDLETEMYRL